MRKLVPALLLFVYAFSSTAQSELSASRLKTGSVVPDFRFEIAPGTPAHIADYEGSIVLLNFFATWCAPCNAEFRHLQKEIWEVYKNNPHFVFFAFGRAHNWEEVRAFARQKQVSFAVLPDPDRKIFSLFAKAYIPRNVVLDEDGRIIYQSVGFVYQDFKALKQLLAKRLATAHRKNKQNLDKTL